MELPLAVSAPSRLLAAVLLMSLLTVTPSADLHHINKHLIMFPADYSAKQNNRKQPDRAVPNTTSSLVKCFPQQVPPTAALLLEKHCTQKRKQPRWSSKGNRGPDWVSSSVNLIQFSVCRGATHLRLYKCDPLSLSPGGENLSVFIWTCVQNKCICLC